MRKTKITVTAEKKADDLFVVSVDGHGVSDICRTRQNIARTARFAAANHLDIPVSRVEVTKVQVL